MGRRVGRAFNKGLKAAELISRFRSTFGPPEEGPDAVWACGDGGRVRAMILDRGGVAVVWISSQGAGFRSSVVFTEVRDGHQASALVRYLDLLCVGRPVGVILEAAGMAGA